uniref:Uncharacterized protein n=1 Tax=Schistosoma japonicum TaxID=6182 RepID=C1LFX2_SCHJA|nr:hypothetical protein [Schistosoma japonicum]
MKMNITLIICIFTIYLIHESNAVTCGNGEECDVGETFMQTTYCCEDSTGKQACCKEFRWWPLTVTICSVGLLIVIIIVCSCCYGLCDCIFCCC